MAEARNSISEPSDCPSNSFAYRYLEDIFLTFYTRNQRLKNSLSWRITLPIRRVSYYVNAWHVWWSRVNLAARNLLALCHQPYARNPADFCRNLYFGVRIPKRINLAYYHWRQAHPLPRLKDDEIVPRRVLVLLGTEALHSPHLAACHASLREQRNCQVDIASLSVFPLASLRHYDAVLLLRMAAMLVPDYGQLICRALEGGKTLCYADHDTRLSAFLHERPFFKPAFSPELLGQIDYLAAGYAISPDWLIQQAKISNEKLTEAALHAALRCLQPSDVEHIPLCLSHLPPSAPVRLSPLAPSPLPTASEAQPKPRVTVIIPTAFVGSYLRTLLQSLHLTTEAYRQVLEVVIITCDSPAKAEDALKDAPLPCRVLYHDQDFNYAAVNNAAVQQTDGEILVFLNDDIELHDRHWLPDMLALLQRPRAGAVGAKLLYPDGTIQHAGCLIGMNGGVGHIGIGLPGNTEIYHGVLTAQREVSAVTGACMAIRRDVFDEAGRFDENLPFSFNDIALCMRLRDLGYTHYISTRSRITHYESRSRGYDDTPRKYQANREYFLYARTRYPGLREADPYYSPNLDLSQPYLAYASLSPIQLDRVLHQASSGCLFLLAQRMNYDPAVAPLLDVLARARSAGPVRVLIAGEKETRFSEQCQNRMFPGTVSPTPLSALKASLVNAPESVLILDLCLLEVMEGLPPSLPLIGLTFQDGQACLMDLFGRRIQQHEADYQLPADITNFLAVT